MNQLKSFLIIVLSVLGFTGYSQVEENSMLFKELKAKDSILFEISFNKCQLEALDNLLGEDLEFYHDQGGINNSKNEFISTMKNGICSETNNLKSRRELIDGSLKVFPLYDNGDLYGAFQTGEHRFFESHKGEPEKAGSIAKFSHLWLKENNEWKLKRVISYDHKMPSIVKKPKIEVSQKILDSYSGNYKAEKVGLVKFLKIENGLEIIAGEFKSPIFPTTQTLFFHEQRPLTFEFIKDNNGNVTKVLVRENGIIVEEAIKQ
ncbi:MAG TPA: nuclear transport factor 2 family protein [Flavobacteriaceae bacterium]|nr:nuclear transport factor 2 family protein [Flavobacteriaceae bacterium]